MRRSPGPTFSVAGTQKPMTSTSPSTCSTRSFRRCAEQRARACGCPGVSTITSWPAGRFRMPRIARRVVCGLSLVIATFSPTSAFVSVDLPTFGRPTNVTKPERPRPLRSRSGSVDDSAFVVLRSRSSPFCDTRTSPVAAARRISPVRGAGADDRLRGVGRLAALDEHRRDSAAAAARRAAGHDEAAVLRRRTRAAERGRAPCRAGRRSSRRPRPRARCRRGRRPRRARGAR